MTLIRKEIAGKEIAGIAEIAVIGKAKPYR
jgi:hypothetical protein